MAASTKGWSLDFLISKAPDTFRHADRVSAKLPIDDLNAKIKEYERSGLPLVIEGFHDLDIWPKEELNLDRFVERSAEDTVSVRNVHTWADSKVKLTDFVERSLTMSPYVQENETVRWYGKDMECPKSWEEWLRSGNVVPTMLLGNGSHDLFRYRPESAPVQTLMCYLGIGDTFTPCHKDLCASFGQNLMCYTENNGSSFWFMTASSTAPKASKYFQDLLQELDHENHVVTVEELAKAPFEVYVLEQKWGDLVLVPPRSCHQVVNSGGITIKTSWSRMTLKGLITAYYHEIPIYRRVCRPEIYKVKSTIFHTIIGQTRELGNLMPKGANLKLKGRKSRNSNQDSPIETLANSLKELIPVADAILSEEYDKMGETMPKTYNGSNRFIDESSLTCDFCGGDIFQSFFECVGCVEGGINITDRLHICPGCYVDGRSCACSNLQPQQYGKFQDLIDVRDKAVEAVHSYEHLQGKTFTAELKLRNEKFPQLFRAACRLYTHRLQSTSKERVCTSRQKHPMSHDEGLNCKGCHHSKCFTHILEYHKVHVADALLLCAGDKTRNHQRYHANHLSKSAMFKDDISALELNQAQGLGHTGYSQLVFNALNYSHCVPLRHAQYLRAGWYDNHIFMDEEESGSLVGPDGDTTHATTTRDNSPFVLDNNRPILKITLPAMKSNPPTAMTSSSLTRSSSLLSASGNTLDTTDIPVTPESYDSDNPPLTELSFHGANYGTQGKEPPVEGDAPISEDDMPLAPPSPAPSDSESEDVNMVDAFIRGPPDSETSPSEDNEHVVEPRKRMIPYVLVPRLKAREKMKYDLPRARTRIPYVLVPPAPYSIERHFRQEGAGVSQSPVQKAGRVRSDVSPKASASSKLKTVSPVKKAPITINTTQTSKLSKKRKSEVLTTKVSPPRPNPSVAQTYGKIVKAKSGLIVRILPRKKPTQALQAQAQQLAKKVVAEGTASRTPFSWSSIRKRSDSVRKWPPISKTRKDEANVSANAPAPDVQAPSTSQSAPSSSSQSDPSSSSNHSDDLQQQSGLQQPQSTSSIPHRNVQQDAPLVSQDLAGTAQPQPSVPEISGTPGSHSVHSPPTEPRKTRLQRQQALGQCGLSDVPWRAASGVQQYDGQGFYGKSDHGRYSHGRPYQNHNQCHPHSMHPYLKYQRNRNKFGHHQQGIGRPGSSRHNPIQQSRASGPFLIPNAKLQRLSYPEDVNNGEGGDRGGDEEEPQGSSSMLADDGRQPRVGSPTFLKSPPRQPRRHHLFYRVQHDRGQGGPSDLGWKKGKVKGKGNMREWQREEEMDMKMKMKISTSKNSNSLFVRLGMIEMAGDEPDMSRSYHSRQGARKSASSFVDNDGVSGQHLTISPRWESTHSPSRSITSETVPGRTEPPRQSNRTDNRHGTGRGDRMDVDYNMRSRTPTSGLATLVDEESAPTFPGTDSGLIVSDSGEGSRAGGGGRSPAGVDVQDMEVDDLMQPVVGGGGEGAGGGGGYWEEEEGTEEEKEKQASEKASRRQEEEEDSPMKWEEEEGEEEATARPPPHMNTSVASPEVDEEEEENTSQIWEYDYALEEQNELSGVYPPGLKPTAVASNHTPFFLRVEEEDGYDEVSLGESEDDYA